MPESISQQFFTAYCRSGSKGKMRITSINQYRLKFWAQLVNKKKKSFWLWEMYNSPWPGKRLKEISLVNSVLGCESLFVDALEHDCQAAWQFSMNDTNILLRGLMEMTVFKESQTFYKTNVHKWTSSNYLYVSALTVLHCLKIHLDPFQGN